MGEGIGRGYAGAFCTAVHAGWLPRLQSVPTLRRAAPRSSRPGCAPPPPTGRSQSSSARSTRSWKPSAPGTPCGGAGSSTRRTCSARQTRREAVLGVAVERIASPVWSAGQRLGQGPHVGHREVQALGPGGGNDVERRRRPGTGGRVHRLDHEAAHAGDALLQHRPVGAAGRRRWPGACAALPRCARRATSCRSSSGSTWR